jgi:hypothetical protein
VFDAVYLRPVQHPITGIEGYEESAELIDGGAYWVEPRLREEMVVMRDWEGGGRAILRQVPLHIEGLHFAPGRGVPE